VSRPFRVWRALVRFSVYSAPLTPSTSETPRHLGTLDCLYETPENETSKARASEDGARSLARSHSLLLTPPPSHRHTDTHTLSLSHTVCVCVVRGCMHEEGATQRT